MKANRRLVLASLAILSLLSGTAQGQRRSSDYVGDAGRIASGRAHSEYTRAGAIRASRHSSYGGRSYRAPRQTWIAGHYEFVNRDVWIPGRIERVYVEPIFETRWNACGLAVRVVIREGYFRDVRRHGHFISRSVRTWIPGQWSYR